MVSCTLMPASALDSAAGDLVLRVCGSSRDGQIVRLKSPKCTIGAGQHCTLRLRARGLRPVHCLVLRGRGGTVIRRWSPDTRVNGQSFTDAPLQPGDRLDIGAIGLEILQTGGPAGLHPSEPQVAPPQAPVPSLADQRAQQLDALAAQLHADRTGLEHEREQWNLHCAEAQQQLSKRSTELDALQAELAAREESIERRVRQAECEGAGRVPDDEPDDAPALQPEAPETPSVSRSPELPAPSPQPNVEQSQAHVEDEESIDDYMSRLLSRARGSGGAEGSSVTAPETVSKRQPDPPTSPAHEEFTRPDSLPKATPRRKPVELSPRAIAPEKTTGLSAMRELANLSSQSALSRHARRQMAQMVRTKLAVAAAGLVAGGLLIWMWRRNVTGPVVFYAALVSFLAGLLWAIQYALLSGRIIFNKAGHLDWNGASTNSRENCEASPAQPRLEDTADAQATATAGSEPAAVHQEEQEIPGGESSATADALPQS